MAFSKLEFGRAWQMPGLLLHKLQILDGMQILIDK